MKIFSTGATFFGGQIDRINQGFISLGHEITPYIDDADLVYSNNFWNDQIIKDKIAGHIRGKIIFNCLDIAPHLLDFPLDRFKGQAKYADAITTISTFVQNDLKARAGVESTVIYNPIKPITRLAEKPQRRYRAMFVGRVNDPAKNTIVAAQALYLLGFSPNEVITVGDQPPFFGGDYWGIAMDEQLNQLYNEVDFVMFTSKSEGLGLPMTEAMAAGAIPVVLRELGTHEEFLPLSIFPEYGVVENDPRSVALFIARFLQNDERMREMKDRLYNHFEKNWREKLSGVGVAKAILQVYEKIK